MNNDAKVTNIGDTRIIIGRYYNANYHACAVVAVITQGIDWAAYINGVSALLPEYAAAQFVADRGSKLSREDAKYYFPEIKLPYRG